MTKSRMLDFVVSREVNILSEVEKGQKRWKLKSTNKCKYMYNFSFWYNAEIVLKRVGIRTITR